MIDFDFAPDSSGSAKPARKPFTPFADWPTDGQGGSGSRGPVSNEIPAFVNQLNDCQREAVLITEGPLIVLAGAGSGKTKMLTSRIAYLIETQRALPHEILAVTFTNKAAGEMRERVERTLGQDPQHNPGGHWGFRVGVPEIGTFHSVCVRLLRREQNRTPFTKPFVIYDDSDQLSLVKAALQKLSIDDKAFSPKGIQAAINRAKCDAIEPHELEPAQHNVFEKQVKRVYEQYQKDLFANNALDFGEIICMAYRLLRDHADIREKYQKRFRYIHVDEYQDTNRSQYLLLSVLANPKSGSHGNICVVGDEDQSIYKWRGADIRNILEFEKDYAGAQGVKTVKLEQNYRSTQTIIKAAGHVIKNNTSRKDKTLWTDNEEGVPIVRAQVADERMEAELVVSEIKRLAEADSRPYKDFSIFYRTNAQSRQFEDVFRREKIPYQIVGGLRFYDRKEIKDIISYLKVLLNPSDSISIKRVINVPARGIGKTTIDKLDQFHVEMNQPGRGLEPGETRSYWDALLMLVRDPSLTSPATAKKLGQFAKLVTRLIEEQPKLLLSELYHLILDETGYIRELRKEATEESLARIENLEEFDTLLLEFEEDYFARLPQDISEEEKNERKQELLPLFIEQSALASDADSKNKGENGEAPAPSVKLMTLHSSKGLEFPVVFLVGMEEGLFPSIKPWEETPEEDIEEERRLCYVGMTRARENLYMLNAVMRRIWGNTNYSDPSRFFAEIPEEYIEFKDLSRSQGARYGGSYRQPEYGSTRKGFGDSDFNQDNERQIPASRPGKSHLVGQKLNHPEYGPGTILAVEGSGDETKVTIEFKGRQQRKFLARYLAAYLEGSY
jgi:DNA helicase-2/ATP-dependent DNA helicase PcrA